MNFEAIQSKLKKFWEEQPELYRADDSSNKPKKYVLVEFPYPSGSGLHVGHAFTFTGGDVYARYLRMKGNNVMFPMGWDAFGLPTENYAIKTKQAPQKVTKDNTDMFKSQMKELAFSFDWKREVNTTDPAYYKWTQWIFVKLFEHGLAYKKEMPINWCPSCKIGLANEEVVNGHCERCGSEVSRRNISQWVVKITDYADKLINGLEKTDFIEKVKQAQINWIGKSTGAKIKFKILGRDVLQNVSTDYLEVFTTRPDTLYGATFMVIAPEHEIALKLAETDEEIKNYQKLARGKSELERTELNKEKTGVFTGLYAINPITNKEIPIWISDFVLASYGTGAIMSVPAHDERDFAFAKRFNLPIRKVIDFDNELHITVKKDEVSKDFESNVKKYCQYQFFGELSHGYWGLVIGSDKVEGENACAVVTNNLINGGEAYVDGYLKGRIVPERVFIEDKNIIEKTDNYMFCYTGVEKGLMVNSGEWNGLKTNEVIKKAIDYIKAKGLGEGTSSYHLRDWIFSRQHYWGEPIPMVNCPVCGWVPEKLENLPIVLPEVEAYEPTDDGRSPLSKIDSFVKCRCPKCGGEAERETDTMPNWAGSDWYFMRYTDPDNDTVIASDEMLKKWMPVDVYIGGDEHNTLHLLYSRFIYLFLHDIGAVPGEIPEPYYRRMSHGVILGPDNQRMSKSRGNVIVPDDVTKKYGVDAVRMYLMFMGPFDGTMAWNEKTLNGVKRFLDRFETFVDKQIKNKSASSDEVKSIINKLIVAVEQDYLKFGFNTVVAKLMESLNSLNKEDGKIGRGELTSLLKVMAPLAPYITDELWLRMGNTSSIHSQPWPDVDSNYLIEKTIVIPIALNGKVRGQLEVDSELADNEAEILKLAVNNESIIKWIGNNQIRRQIYIKKKMVNLVI